jgi:hypothetical protein
VSARFLRTALSQIIVVLIPTGVAGWGLREQRLTTFDHFAARTA